jgi:hypothetical protein
MTWDDFVKKTKKYGFAENEENGIKFVANPNSTIEFYADGTISGETFLLFTTFEEMYKFISTMEKKL